MIIDNNDVSAYCKFSTFNKNTMIKKSTIIISGGSGGSVPSSFVGKMAVVKMNSSSQNYKTNEHINEAVSKVLEGYDWSTVQQTMK